MRVTLTALALCAAPLLAQAQAQAQNCTGDNADGEYILGEAEGSASAMHWPTGLVWKRCLEGMGFSGGQCTGTATINSWQNWATSHLPKYFTDSGYYPHSAPSTQNLLASGAWRMAYKNELVKITENCGNNPKVNRTVFPDTPSSDVWSGSPYDEHYAFVVGFGVGDDFDPNRTDTYPVRLVRGGQPFAALTPPPAQAPATGAATVFPTFTLAASSGAGTAWGGARIQGYGAPTFQINGAGDWVTQAIVKSGDRITVRMTPPLNGSHSAMFLLHSGLTAGTSADGANSGLESTALQALSASFALYAPPGYPITASASPSDAGRVVCTPERVLLGGSATCQALAGAHPLQQWTGACAGQSGPVCTLTDVRAALTVTAHFDTSRVIARALNDTGVPFSGAGNSGNTSTCDSTSPAGQDCHYGRDAGAASGQLAKTGASASAANGFDYTKIANDGTPLPASAPLGSGPGDWACTRDNVTGLVWEVKTASGLHDQDYLYTWHDPRSPDGEPGEENPDDTCYAQGRCDTAKFVQDVNAAGLCGARDWRLPGVQELESLLDMGRAAGVPAIDPDYFPNTPLLPFWSSTPLADHALLGDATTPQVPGAWAVDFDPQGCESRACPLDRVFPMSVRLVRGGS